MDARDALYTRTQLRLGLDMSAKASPTIGRVAAAVPHGDGVSSDERWQLVLRIVASRQFAKSNQLRDILLYISQRAMAESNVSIKEHEIGCAVLGRGEDFDPHQDNIVRVQVGHLRKRLDEYFAGEGEAEPLRLLLPKGSYVPRFETVASPQPKPFELAPKAAGEPEETPGVSPLRKYRTVGLALCGLAVCAACFLAGRLYRPAPAVAKPAPMSAADRLWSVIFSSQPTTIVVSDTCMVMLQDILDTDISLENYLSGPYPGDVLAKAKDKPLRSALELIASRQYTSLADLNTTAALVRLGERYSATPVQIRYSRHLNVREFKSGNFIMMGSRKGIPWSQLFEQRLDFSMEEDGTTKRYYFRNNHPRPGEPAAWRQRLSGNDVVESYADIAVVPNLSGSGYIMLLSGLTMHSTEAAGELVSGREFSKALASLAPAGSSKAPPRYFELLLRTGVIAGATKNATVVASRILQPEKNN